MYVCIRAYTHILIHTFSPLNVWDIKYPRTYSYFLIAHRARPPGCGTTARSGTTPRSSGDVFCRSASFWRVCPRFQAQPWLDGGECRWSTVLHLPVFLGEDEPRKYRGYAVISGDQGSPRENLGVLMGETNSVNKSDFAGELLRNRYRLLKAPAYSDCSVFERRDVPFLLSFDNGIGLFRPCTALLQSGSG